MPAADAAANLTGQALSDPKALWEGARRVLGLAKVAAAFQAKVDGGVGQVVGGVQADPLATLAHSAKSTAACGRAIGICGGIDERVQHFFGGGRHKSARFHGGTRPVAR